MRGLFHRGLFVLVPALFMATSQVVHALCSDTDIYLGAHEVMLESSINPRSDTDLGGATPNRIKVNADLQSEGSQAVVHITVEMYEQGGDSTMLRDHRKYYVPIDGLRPPYCNYWGASVESGEYVFTAAGAVEDLNLYATEGTGLIGSLVCRTNTPGGDLGEVGCTVYIREPVTVRLSSLRKDGVGSSIAVGTIKYDGTVLLAQPPGVTAIWDDRYDRYEITIPGENFYYTNFSTRYTALVTPSSYSVLSTFISSVSRNSVGRMLVYLRDAENNSAQSTFNFVVYK